MSWGPEPRGTKVGFGSLELGPGRRGKERNAEGKGDSKAGEGWGLVPRTLPLPQFISL